VDTDLLEFREKNNGLIEEGIKLVFRLSRKKPCTDFTNEQMLLKGISSFYRLP